VADPEIVTDPFELTPVQELPLDRSPLVAVMFQARFPQPVTLIEQALKSKELVRAFEADYPYAKSQQVFNILLQSGLSEPKPELSATDAWQVSDAAEQWTVSLTQEAIGATVKSYKSRGDFRDRAKAIFETVLNVIPNLPPISRLGVRYSNRVQGDGVLKDWHSKLAPEVGGLLALMDKERETGKLSYAMNDIVYRWPDENIGIQARWGMMPPGAILDATFEAVNERNWVLDIDAFIEDKQPFDPSDLAAKIDELAQREYRFFRWAVLPEGLKTFRS
jgi:uncharacterized protein (TIGR04255 family)